MSLVEWKLPYPSGAPEFTPGFSGVHVSFICMFCKSLFVLLYFLFWPSCYLFFFGIRIMITPSNSSYNTWQFILIVQVCAYQFWSLKYVLLFYQIEPLSLGEPFFFSILSGEKAKKQKRKRRNHTTRCMAHVVRLVCFFLVPDELHEGFQYCGAIIPDMFMSRNPYQVQLMTFLGNTQRLIHDLFHISQGISPRRSQVLIWVEGW